MFSVFVTSVTKTTALPVLPSDDTSAVTLCTRLYMFTYKSLSKLTMPKINIRQLPSSFRCSQQQRPVAHRRRTGVRRAAAHPPLSPRPRDDPVAPSPLTSTVTPETWLHINSLSASSVNLCRNKHSYHHRYETHNCSNKCVCRFIKNTLA